MSQISYKTNYICKKTEILIDLAFIQERIGFIFFDASQNVRVLLDDNLIENNPDNFTVLKAGFLEKVGGWKIHLISFREWMKKYETKQKRVEFLSKCLNLNMNME